MYVGGLRVTLPSGVTYLNQSDWLDAAAGKQPQREYVYLGDTPVAVEVKAR